MVGSKLAVPVLAVVSAYASAGQAPCEVLTEQSNPKCFRNVAWARTDGMKEHPEYYIAMPFLNTTANLSDFQYALAMGEEEGGKHWNCSLPCELTTEAQTHMDAFVAAHTFGTASSVNDTEVTATTTEAPAKDAWQWYYWVLIGVGVCCCMPLLGLACSALICYESVSWIFGGETKRAPKKKRGTRGAAAAAAPVPAQTPAPMPAPVQAHPVQLATYHPVSYAVAPPVYTTQARSVAVAPYAEWAHAATAPAYATAPVVYPVPVVATQYFPTPTSQ